MKRPRLDVNLEELDQIIDRGTHAPLSESEGEKLKRVLHALAGMRSAPRIRGTGATVLGPTPARTMLPFRTPRCTPATHVRAAKTAKFIRRKNPGL